MSGGSEADMAGLMLAVARGRWFMVFATILIASAAGATYLFGAYSKDLKETFGYDQKTLNTISFFKDLGANVGVLAGLLNEVAAPWVLLALGSTMNFFGYFMIWLTVTRRLPSPHLWQLCLYICIGANSQSFANTGALVTLVKNFPHLRGVVLGLMKGYTGLSGAIFTQLFHALYGNDSKSLILLIAWLPAALSAVFIYTVCVVPVVRQRYELRLFYRILYLAIALAAFLMIMIIVQKRFSFTQPEYGASAAVLLLLLLLPLAIVLREEVHLWNRRKLLLQSNPIHLSSAPSPFGVSTPEKHCNSNAPVDGDHRVHNSLQTQPPHSLLSHVIRVFKSPDRGEDHTILQALVSIDMLILFVASICGLGGNLAAIDNMGQIGQSLGYPDQSISTFVSLISIWNFAGRVAAGFSSETLIARYKFPRTLMLASVLLLSCVGHLLIAFGVPGSLYVASVIIGFCFGASWPLMFAIICDIFGLKYYSTLYNFGSVASPIGSYLFNVRVVGVLYDTEASKQRLVAGGGAVAASKSSGKAWTCIGVQCFKKPFILITVATLFGALVSLVLVMRTWKFYAGDIYAKFRDTPVVGDAEMKTADGGNVEVGGVKKPAAEDDHRREEAAVNGECGTPSSS